MRDLLNKGAARQIKVFLALPAEIKGLLAEFQVQDQRAAELREAKERRNAEVR